MDTVTQIALGSAVAVAVMGRKVPVWQSALWGAAIGTAPDLDVVMDFGDAILNMIRHRAETHSLAYLTIAAVAFAGLARLIHRRRGTFWRWAVAFWLVLMTHVGIDYATVYGTQLALPFTDHPFGQGNIYVIDPLYTLPLLIGLIACLASRTHMRWTWNGLGLLVSSAYMAWTLIAQVHVTAVARASLPPGMKQGEINREDVGAGVITSEAGARDVTQLLVSPAPLNSILWRVIAVTPDHYYEGWYSLLDKTQTIEWAQFDRGAKLIRQHRDHPGVNRVARFSHGFYRMHQKGSDVFVTDIRMGFEPDYVFDFNLGPVDQNQQLDAARPSIRQGSRPEIEPALRWLGRRILGNPQRQPGG